MRLLIPVSLGTFLIALAATLTGCASAPALRKSPRPDPTPVIAAHTQKDAAITDSAGRIDELAKPTPIAAPVRAETDRIREQIAHAPASDIATITHAYARELDSRDGAIAALQTRLDKEELKARRAYKRWLYGAASALFLAFAVSILFGKAAALARTWPLGLLGLGAITLAQILETTWFQIGSLIVMAAAITYLTVWVIQKHRDGTLAQKSTARLHALSKIVKDLDQAYENAGEDVKRLLDRNLFENWSRTFTTEEKAEIHDIRKEALHA